MKLYIHAVADPGEGLTASLIFGPKLKLKGQRHSKNICFLFKSVSPASVGLDLPLINIYGAQVFMVLLA